MSVPTNNDNSVCPICGNNNQCAISMSCPPENCWCQSATISASTLSNVPKKAVNVVCICAACARQERESTHE